MPGLWASIALTLAACPCALLDAEQSYYAPEFVMLRMYNHKQQCQQQHFCFVFSMALYYGDNTELSIALHVQTLPHLKLRSAEVPLKAEGEAHVHCIYRHVSYSYIYTVLMSPAPNRSVVL